MYGSGESTVYNALKTITGNGLPTWEQWKMFPRILTKPERRTVISLLILILSTSSLLSWRWYKNHTIVVANSGGEYSEGIVGTPRTTNPLLASTDAELALSHLTTRGLTKFDNSGNLIPDLAENINISDDQKTYTIHLKNELKWSDGEPFTADDVLFTLQNTQTPELASPLAASFRGVNLKLIDERTIELTLPSPLASFLSALTVGIIPTHIWQNIPPDRWILAEANLKPIGTGPWRFKALTKDKQGGLRAISVEPNPHTHTSIPYLNSITIKFYADTTSALESLSQGNIEGLGGISATELTNFHTKKFTLNTIALPQYTAIFYNSTTNTLLQNRIIRRALTLGVNRIELVKNILLNYARPITGPFVDITKKSEQIEIITKQYEPTTARDLLSQAGIRWSSQGHALTRDGKEFNLTITTVDYDEYKQIAEYVAQSWQQLGITTKIEIIPIYQFQDETIKSRRYEALLASEVIGLDPDPYPFWHSSQVNAPGLNLAGFRHNEADILLTEARQKNNKDIRLKSYHRFQEILNEENPATFLYSTNYSYLTTPELLGFSTQIITSPAARFDNSEQWYRETKRSWNKR